MDRAERKSRIGEVITNIKAAIKALNESDKVARVDDLIAQLEESLSEFDNVEGFDPDELRESVLSAHISNVLDETEAKSSLEEFQSDLESHMDEQTDYNRERMEEKYSELDTCLENIEYESGDSLEDYVSKLEETIGHLEAMKK